MLTDTRVKALKPQAQTYQVADTGGLSIEVRPSGRKVWLFRYRLHGKAEKLGLGTYPEISLKDARDLHIEARRKVARGESPADERRRAKAEAEARVGVTVKDYAEAWFLDYGASAAPRWRYTVRMWLDRDVIPCLGRLKVAEVKPKDVLDLLDKIKARGAPQSALRVRVILRQVFDYARGRQAITSNPVTEVPSKIVARPRSRDRVLSPAELRDFFSRLATASCTERSRIALQIIAHTLVRKMEVGRARWEDVDLERHEWLIPAENAKNGKPHVVYLSHQAADLFRQLKAQGVDSPWCVPGHFDTKKHVGHATLNTALNTAFPDGTTYTIHDLRRTAATLLAEQGFPGDVVEKALNHTLRGVAGVYNRAEHADQRRAMLQHWSDFLGALSAGGNVVTADFRRRAA